MTASTAPASDVLPELRGDLIVMGRSTRGGDRGCTIYDPVRDAFHRLGPQTHELLSLWGQNRTVDELVRHAGREAGLIVVRQDILALVQFLTANNLAMARVDGSWKRLAEQQRRRRQDWAAWLMHNYLFVKLPVLRPARLLAVLSPIAAPLFTRAAGLITAGLGLAGLYLVSRQWDAFLATFPHMVSLEGALLYLVALAVVKSLHELGHALAAHRYGCRVPTMGICFMLLFPMLYSDVTDAWKLSSRRQRVAIASAGIVVECGLACLAAFAWPFLTDGALRSLAFATATTGLLLCLAINLNPFMRFDGYYILSDAIGIENLQPRAFALFRWKLREVLFGIGMPPPETLDRRLRGWLIAYAAATNLYRLVLFTGIALLIYYATFKLLGLALFAIEIGYLIAWPILQELKIWTAMRKRILGTRRTLWTLSLVAVSLLIVTVPWSGRITAPAIVEASSVAQLYPARSSHVIAAHVRIGDVVAADDVVVRLAAPDLERDVERAHLQRQALILRLERLGADDTDRAMRMVLQDALASIDAKVAGFERERDELTVRTPIPGTIAELDDRLYPGRWLQRRDLIALVVGHDGTVARGYVRENDLQRLDVGRPARFIPDDLSGGSVEVRLEALAIAGSTAIEIAELASHFGGPIAVRASRRAGENRQLVPTHGAFPIKGRVIPNDPAPGHASRPPRIVRGMLHIDGIPESYASAAWRQVVRVLIRESGS